MIFQQVDECKIKIQLHLKKIDIIFSVEQKFVAAAVQVFNHSAFSTRECVVIENYVVGDHW